MMSSASSTVRPSSSTQVPGEAENALGLGDIVYLNAMGQGLMVLGSSRRALDLLEKRAIVYSNRPIMPVMEL